VLPDMLARKWGRIVNVASVASRTGGAYISAYAASKHALLGLTRCVAAEGAAHGVTANAVCPGYVDTDMTQESLTRISKRTGRSREEALASILARSPQNRLVTPEEVAATVCALCDDAAGAINGEAIVIDGGGLLA
jgi:NAD(P)-dependent dehydrogenase (short-subunit alcohol dehydrogenase family)